jgi:SAM-dependent methyltransferase
VAELWRRFRNERDDPAPFYRLLAAELADGLEARHGSLHGRRILDLGCGPGWYTEALRAKGAQVVSLEYDVTELTGPDEAASLTAALLGDAGRLPFPDASLDAVVCSNMLEHAPDTEAVFTELRRVLAPGGWAYMSWTNWYSPWGGHDMSPWHLLGPRFGPRLYERRHGPPRKNRYGEGLFAVHIGPTLRLVRRLEGLTIERAEPRYWPWARPILAVPALRELVTWNCVLHLRRTDVDLASVLAKLDDVAGWMSDAQARRLWDRASELRPGATVVEIGSYQGRSTSVLATAVPDGSVVVAIDPHAGNDRGPQQWEGTADEGESDHQAFLANLQRLGVAGRVRHVRRFSHDALDDVAGEIDLLYIDGAHGFGPARDDIVGWGDRVAAGGTMLIHDAYSSVGVTLALLTTTVPGGGFRYVGRSGSMVEFRKERVPRLGNAARQLAEWPWFAKNLVLKALIVLGVRKGGWPY